MSLNLITAMEDIQTKVKILEISEGVTPTPIQSSRGVSKDLGVDVARWTFGELLGQKRHVSTVNFTATNTFGQVIWNYRHELASLRSYFTTIVTSQQQTWFDLFLSRQWRVKFTFEVESNWQQVGLYILYFHNIPWHLKPSYTYAAPSATGTVAVSTNQGLTVEQAWMLDKQFITLGHNGVYTLETPWQVPLKSHVDVIQGLWNTQAFNSHQLDDVFNGEMVLQCHTPLTVATGGDTTATAKLWVNFEFDQLGMYAPSDFRPGR